jgi:hypothetical protein
MFGSKALQPDSHLFSRYFDPGRGLSALTFPSIVPHHRLDALRLTGTHLAGKMLL